MLRLARFAPLLTLMTALACKSKGAPTELVVARSSASPVSSAAPAASVGVGTASSGPSETELKAFVERWRVAQNSRDFEAYSGLYAERFMGVKRVGTYSKRFNRAGWLADRKPMFEAGAQVKVSELERATVAGATRVVFTQEFSSGSFHDIGKKELFLVASPGGILISKEEMLDSKVSEPVPTPEQVLAYHRDGVVVERGFDKDRLKSAPRLLKTDDPAVVEIAYSVPPEAVSAAARAWLGRDVAAYSTNGKSCTGKVGRFEVRARTVPHSGMRQAWNGELDEPKATPAQIAANVGAMAQGSEHFVVGVLDSTCGGSFATAAPLVELTLAHPATGPLWSAGVAAFKALPAYIDLQKRFVAETKAVSEGWEASGKLLRVVELRVPNHPALLLVSARTDGGCADFSGSLSAFWQIEGSETSPKLSLQGPSLPTYLTLRGALDQGSAGLALLAGPDDFNDELSVLHLKPRTSRRVLLSTVVWECLC